MSEPTEEPVDLRAYLRPIADRKWWIVAIVTVITTATYVMVAHKPKVYQAATSVFIQVSADAGLFTQAGSAPVSAAPSLRDAANQAQLLRSRQIASDVKHRLNSPLPADVLRSRVNVTTTPSTDFVSIEATGPSGPEAADLANAYAQAFVDERTRGIRQQLLDAQKVTSQQLGSLQGSDQPTLDSRDQLRSRLQQLKDASTSPDGGATQVDSAVGGNLVSPHPKRNAIYAFVLSLLAGLVGAVFLEGLNRQFTTSEQLEEAYGLPVLAAVPHVPNPSPVVDGGAELSPGITEPMRTLRVSVKLQTLDEPMKVLLVTSATPAEGKTTVVRNFAMAMAEAGTRVVVVEADLRLPSVARQFGVGSPLGLTDVLLGETTLHQALVTVDAPVIAAAGGAISVLVAGSAAANPPAILGSARMSRIVTDLARRFDVVLIDSPPLLPVSDTLSLLPLAEGIILVGRLKVSTRDAVQRVNDLLSRSPSGRVIGVVVDDVDVSRGFGYQYDYGYDNSLARGAVTPLLKSGNVDSPS